MKSNTLTSLPFFRPALALGALLMLSAPDLLHAQVAAAPGPNPDKGDILAFVELARSDIRTEKALIYAENLGLTPDEAAEFWPMHREYELELNKILDRRVALLMKFAPSAKALTDDQANAVVKESLEIEAERTSLKRKYFQNFTKVISPVKAARFFQIENQLNLAIDLQLAAEMPLIDRAK